MNTTSRPGPIYATRDWHPPDHCSFEAQGGPWPPHCVAGTHGAELADALQLPEPVAVVSKATTPGADAYSGFQGTDLGSRLAERGVEQVFIGGLATDYCVLGTVLDALSAGLEVVVLEAAVRAVNVEPGGGAKALERMRAAGAILAPDGERSSFESSDSSR